MKVGFKINEYTPYGHHYNHGDVQAADWGYEMRAPPAMYLCYLCGREFGSASLPIHQPQCYAKQYAQWMREGGGPDRWGRGGKGQAREPPMSPEERYKAYPGRNLSGAMAAAGSARVFNAREQAAYESHSMCECPHCGRTFRDNERLGVHLKGCRAGGIYANNGFLTDKRRKQQKARVGVVGGAANPAARRKGSGRSVSVDGITELFMPRTTAAPSDGALTPRPGGGTITNKHSAMFTKVPKLPRHIQELIVQTRQREEKENPYQKNNKLSGMNRRPRNPLDEGVIAGPLAAFSSDVVRGRRPVRGSSLLDPSSMDDHYDLL